MNNIILTLWVHGKYGDVDTPCGEVTVFDITGCKVHETMLRDLLDDNFPQNKMDWFGHLPTERALIVLAKDISDEDGINLEVVSFREDPDTGGSKIDH